LYTQKRDEEKEEEEEEEEEVVELTHLVIFFPFQSINELENGRDGGEESKKQQGGDREWQTIIEN